MLKAAVLAFAIVAVVAQEAVVGPNPRPPVPGPEKPLIARLRANSPCAGEKCLPEPPKCDPTIVGDCENDVLPPSQISCDSITHCGPCTMHLHCGWCPTEKRCVAGGVSGPLHKGNNCTAWDYAYCSQDPCSVYQTCSACSGDPMCGWCSGTSSCVEGSAKGPWLNRCSKDSYSYDTCALTATAPVVNTIANIQTGSASGNLLSADE